MHELFGILMHVFFPVLVLYAFAELRWSMEEKEIESPPTGYLLVLLVTYGGWLMVGLTAFFWYWSGMASLGLLYLVLVAPFVTLVMAIMLYRRRGESAFHRAAFLASVAYTCVVGCLIIYLAAVRSSLGRS